MGGRRDIMDYNGVILPVSVILIMTSFFVITGNYGNGHADEYFNESEGIFPMEFNTIIEIDGDDSLEDKASEMGWRGTGSSGDPIIADNISIDGKGEFHCFKITGTNLSLEIRDSLFFNATARSNPYNFGYGLIIYDCRNITLNNCTFRDNRRGLSMSQSTNITLRKCSFIDNVQMGIMVHSTDLVRIGGCNVTGSGTNYYIYYSSSIEMNDSLSLDTGMHLDVWYCDGMNMGNCSFLSQGNARFLNTYDANITDNQFLDVRLECSNYAICNVTANDFRGSVLLLSSQEEITIWDNTFTAGGIQISSSVVSFDDIDISSNNTVNGLPVFYSSNEDHHNTSISGSWGQYILGNVTGLILERKVIEDSRYPVTVIESEYVDILDVSLHGASTGIYVLHSQHITVAGCRFTDIEEIGIYLMITTDSAIVSNNINSSAGGIQVSQWIENITVVDNIVKNCTDGIFLNSWVENSLIKRNHVEKCVNGIQAADINQQDNSIEDNTIIDCERRGLYLHDTTGYHILNNRIIGSGISGIELKQSYYVVLKNNMIEGCDFHSILINDSGRCEFYDNEMHGSGFMLYRRTDVSVNTIPSNNTLDSMPVYYYKGNGEGWTVPDTSGQIVIDGCSNLNVEGIEFNNVSFPVVATQADHLSIKNCQFNDCGKGAIHIFRPSSTIVEGNNITRGERGIEIYNPYIWSSATVTIDGNNLTSISDRAVRVYSLKGLKVESNSIVDCGKGILLDECNNCSVKKNLISRCTGPGVHLYRTHFTRFNENTFHACGRGVSEEYRSNNNLYSFNLFNYCTGPALNIGDQCYKDRIYNNAFRLNNGTGDTSTNGRPQVIDEYRQGRWYHPDGTGNYWHDHRSPDNDEDDIVDIPYVISDTVFDRYPLVDMPFDVASPPSSPYAVGRSGYIVIGWKPPEDTRGFPVEGYSVIRYNSTYLEEVTFDLKGSDMLFNDSSVEYDEVYTYHIQAITALGPSEITGPLTAISDGTPPLMDILNPANGTVINRTYMDIEWQAEDPLSGSGISSVRITLDANITYDVGGSESFRITNLTNGQHSFEILVSDHVGNQVRDIRQFTVDLDNPDLEMIDPVDGALVNTDFLVVRWNASDPTSAIGNYSIRVDNKDWIFLGSNESINVSGLSEGNHTILVRAWDLGGNYNTVSTGFQVDFTPPDLRVSGIVNGSYLRIGRVLINWSADDSISGIESVKLFLDGTLDTDDLVIEEFYIEDLSDGPHNITLIAADNAGNSIRVTNHLIVDTGFPIVVDHWPRGEGVLIDSVIFVHLSEDMDWETITMKYLGIPVSFNRDGLNISYNPSAGMDLGVEYMVTITGTDLAGNPLSFSWNFTTDSTGTVTGQVLSDEGDPISGASVRTEGNLMAITDTDGFFQFNISEGNYQLLISADGYSDKTIFIEVSAGTVNDAGQSKLTPTDAADDVKEEGDSILLPVILVIALILVILIVILIIVSRRSRGADDELPRTFTRAEELREKARRDGVDISPLEADYNNAVYQLEIGDLVDSVHSMESYCESVEDLMDGWSE